MTLASAENRDFTRNTDTEATQRLSPVSALWQEAGRLLHFCQHFNLQLAAAQRRDGEPIRNAKKTRHALNLSTK